MKILVLGANGMVGSNFVEFAELNNYEVILLNGKKDIDFTDANHCNYFVNYLEAETPDWIINCAGYTAGIIKNLQDPVGFFDKNILMQINIFESVKRYILIGDRKERVQLINLGAGCGYPKDIGVLREEDFFNGVPQEQSLGYSMAKKMLLVQSKNYYQQYGLISKTIIPGNIYGDNDNYNLVDSHVIPALIHKVFLKSINKIDNVEVLGDGQQIRDFVYAKDLCLAVMKVIEFGEPTEFYNFSSGHQVTIKEVVRILCGVAGLDFDKTVNFSSNGELNGQKFRVFSNQKIDSLDSNNIIGRTPLGIGLEKSYKWFEDNYEKARI